jgi:hypothetical protein
MVKKPMPKDALQQVLILAALTHKTTLSPKSAKLLELYTTLYAVGNEGAFETNAKALFTHLRLSKSAVCHVQWGMFTPKMIAALRLVQKTSFFDEYDPDYCELLFRKLVAAAKLIEKEDS